MLQLLALIGGVALAQPATRPDPAGVTDAVLDAAATGRLATSYMPAQRAATRMPMPGGDPPDPRAVYRIWALPQLRGARGMLSASRCEPLEALAASLRAMPVDDAAPYLNAAADRLQHEDPAHRAAAIELLCLTGVHTLDLGLLQGVAERLGDDAKAYGGAWTNDNGDPDVPNAPMPIDPDFEPTTLTVGQVAQAGLAHLLPVRFADVDTFGAWWEARPADGPPPLWETALRWRDAPPKDLSGLDGLGGVEALRVALSVGDHTSQVASITAVMPEAAAARLTAAGGSAIGGHRPPQQIATMVKRRGLGGELVAWLSTASHQPYREPLYQAARVLPLAVTRAEAAALRELLTPGDPRLAGDADWLRVPVTRALVSVLPQDEGTAALLEQARRRPDLEPLVLDLIERTGVGHADVIASAYKSVTRGGRPMGKPQIVQALARHGDAARPLLAGLFAATDLTAHREGPYTGHIFRAFAEAANEIADEPVLTDDEIRAGFYRYFKGGENAATREHNAAVPEKRTQAVAKLAAFFGVEP